MLGSMSRKGDCWDNAPVESFFATLKGELVEGAEDQTRADARADLFQYIEGFYNRRRLHAALGYLTPVQKAAAFPSAAEAVEQCPRKRVKPILLATCRHPPPRLGHGPVFASVAGALRRAHAHLNSLVHPPPPCRALPANRCLDEPYPGNRRRRQRRRPASL